jgi:hypothetical protein
MRAMMDLFGVRGSIVPLACRLTFVLGTTEDLWIETVKAF